eukprot:scaffold4443_cov69-Phaeocystis_antarctica.AAC.2
MVGSDGERARWMNKREQRRRAGRRRLAVLIDDHAVDMRCAALLGDDEVTRNQLGHWHERRLNGATSVGGAGGAPAGGMRGGSGGAAVEEAARRRAIAVEAPIVTAATANDVVRRQLRRPWWPRKRLRHGVFESAPVRRTVVRAVKCAHGSDVLVDQILVPGAHQPLRDTLHIIGRASPTLRAHASANVHGGIGAGGIANVGRQVDEASASGMLGILSVDALRASASADVQQGLAAWGWPEFGGATRHEALSFDQLGRKILLELDQRTLEFF